MFAQERRDRIVALVERRGRARVEELEQELSVSSATLRRDLSTLEKSGNVLRVHGGVLPLNGKADEPNFSRKQARARKQKKAIAHAVNLAIPDGVTLLLDAGTTCMECARLLLNRPSLRIITHSVPVLALAMEAKATVLCPGGELRKISGALTGSPSFLDDLHADIALVGASGLHCDEGASTPELAEASIKKQLIDRAGEAWLLADSSKWNHPTGVRFAAWHAFSRWYPGDRIPPADARRLRRTGLTLHQP